MYCPKCGTRNNDFALRCIACNEDLRVASAPPRPTRLEDEPAIRMLLPVGRSGLAIAAGYAGLFAVIPIFSLIAILLGILAIRDIKRNPGKHGMGRAIFGLTMGVLCTIGYLILLININRIPWS